MSWPVVLPGAKVGMMKPANTGLPLTPMAMVSPSSGSGRSDWLDVRSVKKPSVTAVMLSVML